MSTADSLINASLQRIAIFRALGGLGDFLCTVPALRALRRAFPQATISLIGLPQVQSLVARFQHYLDEWIEFPGYPGLPERSPQLAQIPTFFAHMQQRQFDLGLQMHGSGVISNSITTLLGARINAGFYMTAGDCPDDKRFLEFLSSESEVRRYLRLLDRLGIATQGEALEFPLDWRDRQAFQAMVAHHSLNLQQFVCIHPGASVASRRWTPAQFAAVADGLVDWGFQIVLTGSTSETDLTGAIATAMKAPALDLAGKTSLGALAVLFTQARLLVCNDTGVSHLAAALKLPSVVIFTNSDPDRWAPLDQTRHRAVCATHGVTVEVVLAQAERVLQEGVYVAS